VESISSGTNGIKDCTGRYADQCCFRVGPKVIEHYIRRTSPFRPEAKSIGRLTVISLRPILCGRSAHIQSVNFADRKTKNGTMFGYRERSAISGTGFSLTL
jgi:hypothetical protein